MSHNIAGTEGDCGRTTPCFLRLRLHPDDLKAPVVGDALALSLSFVRASLLEIAVGAWLLQRSGPVERFAEDTGQLLHVLLAGALLPQLPGATVSALTLQLLGLQRFALVWDDLYISQRGGGAPAHTVGHVGGVELGHG